MKVGIIGPGIMTIPPTAWGAVEILIWEYYNALKARGIDVTIVNLLRNNPSDSYPNTQYASKLIEEINKYNFDIIHLHYDCLYFILPYLNAKIKAITSHYGYIDNMSLVSNRDYDIIHHNIVSNVSYYILPLSDLNANVYLRDGVTTDRIHIMPNGASATLFRYTETPCYPLKSIYLGKIEDRKCQYKYQTLPMIDFVGGCIDHKFNIRSPQYLGEWNKDKLYESLTDYASLILLSNGEAHPLVVCEALICGLGIVVSEAASANLDRSQDFIDIIPNNKLNDLSYVSEVIQKNQERSIQMRSKIREYGINNFSWDAAVDRYIQFLNNATPL